MAGLSFIETVAWIGAIMLVCGIAGGIVAGLKNRDISYWVGWTFLLPPSLIVLLLLPTLKGPRPRRPTLEEEDRRTEDL